MASFRHDNDDWPPGSFVGRLNATPQRALLRRGVARTFPPAAVLLHEGERTRHALVILSGLVKVTAVTEGGHVALLDVWGRGDLVGELAAVDGGPRSATLTACGTVDALEIGQAGLRAFLDEHPAAWSVMTTLMAERFRTATRRRVELSGLRVRDRLLRLLADFSRNHGRPDQLGRQVIRELSQPELAAAVGCSEAALRNALRELRSQGLVGTGYRQLVLLQPGELARQARLEDGAAP